MPDAASPVPEECCKMNISAVLIIVKSVLNKTRKIDNTNMNMIVYVRIFQINIFQVKFYMQPYQLERSKLI